MKRIYLLVSLLLSLLLLIACGGGGGSDDEEEALTYTGSKTPAVITGENADDLAELVFGPASTPVSGISGAMME